MLTNNLFNLSLPLNSGDRHVGQVSAALNLYRWAQIKGWLGKVRAMLQGRCTCLLNLEKLEAEGQVLSRRYLGVRTISIRQICGSEGRSLDFDRYFNPLRSHTQQRWLNVMLARQADVPLPPVELIQVEDADGERYYVRDGHHRISVAQALGEESIEAEVTVWQLAEAPLPARKPVVAAGMAL